MEQSFSKRCRYFVLLIFCVTGMVIFDRSLVFMSPQMTIHKLIVIALNIFVIGVVPFAFALIPWLARATDAMLRWFMKCIEKIQRNWKKLLLYIGLGVAGWGAAWLLETCIISRVLHEAANDSRRVFVFTIILLGIAVYGFRKRAGQKPEQFFVVVALILGGMLIRISPATLGITADDETHYARVLAEANLFDGSCLDVEQKMLDEFTQSVYYKLAYDRESRADYYAELNAMYEQKNVIHPSVRLHGIWSLSYVPSAIGTIVGQGLSLSFVHVFMLGKLFNLLFYVMLFYFAIKKIPYGKTLLAVFGLVPTSIFMASNYSYDPWVIGFIVLAYSFFFYEIQNPDKKLEAKNVVCMIVFLILGCMPKAVYCVLGPPFLFMPKAKFKDKKQRLMYYMPLAIAGVALLATFAVPALIQGVGSGDSRGGEGINANAQLAYILSDPIAYARVFFHFLKDYLSFGNMQSYMQRYFYFGNGDFYVPVFVILVIVAFLDKKKATNQRILVRISCVAASLLAVAACATVMYIVFTPVGSEQIFGCQGRYILPAMIPFLVAISPDIFDNKIKPQIFTIVPMILVSSTFLYNVYNMSVALY